MKEGCVVSFVWKHRDFDFMLHVDYINFTDKLKAESLAEAVEEAKEKIAVELVKNGYLGPRSAYQRKMFAHGQVQADSVSHQLLGDKGDREVIVYQIIESKFQYQ